VSVRRAAIVASPLPGISEPERRHYMNGRSVWTAVGDADADQQVLRLGLGVLHRHIEIAPLVEYSGVNELKFLITFAAEAVFFAKLIVWVLGLRIFVEILHVGVARCVVQVKIIFLYVLPVISFRSGQTEKPFLQVGVSAVPQSKGETQKLVPITNTSYTVFVPAVGTRSSVFVREVAPRRAISAVVFAHRSPGTLRNEGTPAVPVVFFLFDRPQAGAFGGVVNAHSSLILTVGVAVRGPAR